MPQIFISHASENAAAALGLAKWLEEHGWADYFLDLSAESGLAPGDRWQESLRRAVNQCEAVLVLLSPAWRRSAWCVGEFLLAKQLGVKVFGIMVEATPIHDLPRELTAETQLCDLVTGTARRDYAVCAEGIVPETDVSFAAAGLARLRTGLQKSGLNALTFPWPPPGDPSRAPFRGLKPLEATDAAIFFGRDAPVARGLDALRQVRERGIEGLFVVLAASGAGKSSYVRAGLWPRLERDNAHFFPLPVVRPQGAAITGPTGLLASLELAFRGYGSRSRANLRGLLESEGGLGQLVSELETIAERSGGLGPNGPSHPTILLAIDQAEELFLADGREESDALLRFLRDTLARLNPAGGQQRLVGVMAIRSDAYDRLQADPRLHNIAQVPFNLNPVSHGDFKSIITGPAQRATTAGDKLAIEPALVERLVHDARGPDALPLVAFTLERLYIDYRGDGVLTVDGYNALGGLRGSIEAVIAEAFMEPGRSPAVPTVTSERDQLLRLAFIPWLARIDPDTDERTRRVALWGEIPEQAHAVVERLIEARLLVRDRRVIDARPEPIIVVEVAHEALLRQWPALTSWLDGDADALKGLEEIRRSTVEWLKHQRGQEWLLHTGKRLNMAEGLLGRKDLAQLTGDNGFAYLAACRARDEQAESERVRAARTKKNLRRLLNAGLVLSAASIGWITSQAKFGDMLSSSVLFAATSKAVIEMHYERAMRFAVLLYKIDYGSDLSVSHTEVRMARAAFHSPALARFPHDGPVKSVAFHPDGTQFVTASWDGTARVFDVPTLTEIRRLTFDEAPARVYWNVAAFSPDGQRVVTADADGVARVWDHVTGKLITNITHSRAVTTASFSVDGRYLLTVSDDDTAFISNPETGQHPGPVSHSGEIGSFSPDGRHFVLLNGSEVLICASDSGAVVKKLAHAGSVTSAAFSHDGRIVTGSWDGTARIWNVQSGSESARFDHGSVVTSVALSRDGQRLVTGSDSIARVFEARTLGKEIRRFVYDRRVVAVSISSDADRIATILDGETAEVRTVNGLERLRLHHDKEITSAVFSPDGHAILTGSDDGTAALWRSTPTQEMSFVPRPPSATSATLSPDGSYLLTLDENRKITISGGHKRQTAMSLTTESPLTAVAFSPDGTLILTGSSDGVGIVREVATGHKLMEVTHRGSIVAAALSADGRHTVTVATDRTAKVSAVKTGKEVGVFTLPDSITAVSFSKDNQHLLTTAGNVARLVRVTDGGEILLLTHAQPVLAAVSTADPQGLVTLSGNEIIVSTTKRANDPMRSRLKWAVEGGAFHPNLRRLAIVTKHGGVVVADIESGEEVATLRVDEARSVAFNTDGSRLYVDSKKGVTVWDVRWAGLIGHDLVTAVCRDKLVGARRLSEADIHDAPALFGRKDDDVCAPESTIQRLKRWWRGARGR